MTGQEKPTATTGLANGLNEKLTATSVNAKQFQSNEWKVYSKVNEIFGNGTGKRWENISWRLFNANNNLSSSTPASNPPTPIASSSNMNQLPPIISAGVDEDALKWKMNFLKSEENNLERILQETKRKRQSAESTLRSSQDSTCSSATTTLQIPLQQHEPVLFCFNCKSVDSEIWHKSTTTQPIIILCNFCLLSLADSLIVPESAQTPPII